MKNNKKEKENQRLSQNHGLGLNGPSKAMGGDFSRSQDQIAQSPAQHRSLPVTGHPSLLCATCSSILTPLSQKCFPYVRSKPILIQFKTLSLCPVILGLGKKSYVFNISLLKGHNKIFLESLLVQIEQLQLSQPYLKGAVFHPSESFPFTPAL